MNTRIIIAFVAAVLAGAFTGSLTHDSKAQAASVGVLVQCSDVSLQGVNYIFSCGNAPGDTSGIGLTMQITSPTNRYPLGVPATITLP